MPARQTPYLIGIAGPSGSGKTVLAGRLGRMLCGIVLPLDHYYRPLAHLTYEDRCRSNFDHPDSLDWPLVEEQFRALRSGQSIHMPQYDFAAHTRKPETVLVDPHRFIIVEGILALHREGVRSSLDTRVYVELEDDTCFARRLYRDVHERGRSAESVGRQYAETVRPMCEGYIRPSRHYADVIVRGDQPLELSTAAVLEHVRANSFQGRGFTAGAAS